MGLRRRHLVHAVQEPLAGSLRLVERSAPVAPHLHQLGSVAQALPREGDEIGLPVTPVGQRLGPRVGSTQFLDLVAPLDDAAVDDPCHHRREVVGGDGHHCLVEQPEAVVDPSQAHEGSSLGMEGEGDEVGLVVLLADRDGLRCGLESGFEFAGIRLVQHLRYQQVAGLGTRAPVPLDEPAGPRHPARSRPGLSAQCQIEADPEPGAGGCQRVAFSQVELMGSLQKADHLVFAPDHVAGDRQLLEVRRGEGLRCVGGGERLMCVEPRPRRHGAPPSLQIVLHVVVPRRRPRSEAYGMRLADPGREVRVGA